jgi:histidyl-tRNA synthetase
VVLLEVLKARSLLPQFDAALDAFCLIEDEALRAESLKLIHDLRAVGLAVDYSLTPAKSDKQFKRAQDLKAAHTIKLGRNEAGEFVAKLKNLKTRQETVVPPAQAAAGLSESRAVGV